MHAVQKPHCLCTLRLKFKFEIKVFFPVNVGALANLGHSLSDQTVGSILRRHGITPAPKRSQTTSWKDSIAAHMNVLAGADFFHR